LKKSASTPYQFKEGPNAMFVELLKANHDRDTANPQYVTVEMKRKKVKALMSSPVQTSNIDISKQLFRCNGFLTGLIQNSNYIQNLEMASKGFCHLVGQGIHNKARAISNQLS
jgi:hypothetical protein